MRTRVSRRRDRRWTRGRSTDGLTARKSVGRDSACPGLRNGQSHSFFITIVRSNGRADMRRLAARTCRAQFLAASLEGWTDRTSMRWWTLRRCSPAWSACRFIVVPLINAVNGFSVLEGSPRGCCD